MSFRALIEVTDTSANGVHIQNWTSGRTEYGQYYDCSADDGTTWVSAINASSFSGVSTSAGSTGSYYADIEMSATTAISGYDYTQLRLLYTTSANEELTSELIWVNKNGLQTYPDEETIRSSDLQNIWYERWLIEEYELPWNKVNVRYLDLTLGDDTGDGSTTFPYRNVSAFVNEANQTSSINRKNDTGWLLFCRRGDSTSVPRILDYNITPANRVNIAIIGTGKATHVYGSNSQIPISWSPETNVPATHYVKGAASDGDLIIRGIAFDSTTISAGTVFKGMIRGTDGGSVLRVENNEFVGIDDSQASAGGSISINDGYDVFIQNNTFYEGNMYVDGFDGVCRIRNNEFHYTYAGAYYSETSAHGVYAYIYLRGGYGVSIENNSFTDHDRTAPVVVAAGYGGGTIIGPNRFDGWWDSSTADTTPYYFMGTSGGTPDAGKGLKVYHVQESSGNLGYEVERNQYQWARAQVFGSKIHGTNFTASISTGFSGTATIYGEPTMNWNEDIEIGDVTSAGFTSAAGLSAWAGEVIPMFTIRLNPGPEEDITLTIYPWGIGGGGDGVNSKATVVIPVGTDNGQIMANGTMGYFDINNYRDSYDTGYPDTLYNNQYMLGPGYGGGAGGSVSFDADAAASAIASAVSGAVVSGIGAWGDLRWSKIYGIPLDEWDVIVGPLP